MSAAYEVLACPELLHMILLEADQHTLLTSAQRVCRAWHDQLYTAPLLKRHLFFHIPSSVGRPREDGIDAQDRKDDASDQYDQDERRFRQRVRNPLLRKPFPLWFNHDLYFRAVVNNRYHNNILQYAIVSSGHTKDFMKRLAGAWADDHLLDSVESPPLVLDEVISQTRIFGNPPADNPFLRANASWQYMHVADPPVTRVGLLQGNSGSGDEDTIQEVAYPDGLRMGEYYVLVMACSRLLNCSYGIQIQWPSEPLGRTIQRYTDPVDVRTSTSETVNQGLMRADVLVLVGRGFPVEMAEPTDGHERTLIAGGYVFFMEHYRDEFARIEKMLKKPRMEEILGYYLK